MRWLINWIKSIFSMFLGRGIRQRYTRRLESKGKSATISKAQAKLLKKRTQMDKKIFRGQDKIMLGPRKKRKRAPPKK